MQFSAPSDQIKVTSPGRSHAARLAAHANLSNRLALCSDRELRELTDKATTISSGIGGRTTVLNISDTPVFVKQLRLTELEMQSSNFQYTANLFGLPDFCHYGIGTPGFGAWRELATQTMTTRWVISGDYEGFPLMYHWRVVSNPVQPLPAAIADIDRTVEYWGGGDPVRRRIVGLQDSSAALMLFLEFFPQNLHQWLAGQVAAGDGATEAACVMVENELQAGIRFMNSHDLLHFDAHFENILTDGQRLFFADYGLSISADFDLSMSEAEFYERHRTYDRCYASTQLVRWAATGLCGYEIGDREAFARACARGELPTGVPGAVAAIIARHAPAAATMEEFFRKLKQESRTTPYPLGDCTASALLGGSQSPSYEGRTKSHH